MDNVEYIERLPGLPDRPEDSHKGMFGRILVVGGSPGMLGAVSLTTMSAMRSGAGLVTFATSALIQQSVAMLCECATSVRLDCDEKGNLDSAAISQVVQASRDVDIVAVGPGFGLGEVQQEIIQALLRTEKPIIIDADGINNLCLLFDWQHIRSAPVILTPHPGELSSLTGYSVEEIQANREQVAVETVRQFAKPYENIPLILALKGANTIVTDGTKVFVNSTGNPGLATAGSGDVLTGIIAGLSQQGVDLFDATCLATFIHGRAGDLAAEELTQVSMIATDVMNYIGDAIAEIFG